MISLNPITTVHSNTEREPYDPKVSDRSSSNKETVGQRTWEIERPGLKADVWLKIFERMDLGSLLASCQVDKFSMRMAIRVLSAKALKGFPDLASVSGPIPFSTIMARIKKVHKLAENCGCELDLLEQEKANPTIKGTRLLEEYLDQRSTLIIWQELADSIGVSTKPDLSNLNSVADFRNEASKFRNWFNTHINQLNHLQWLSLNGNNLTSLPPEIGKLPALQTLAVIGNKLISSPSLS